MKHTTTHPFPSSSSSSSKSVSASDSESTMQVKGVRKLVRKLKRGIRHISQVGHHSKSATLVPEVDGAPSASLVGLLRDVPVVPISLPLTHNSKASCASMASTTPSGSSSHQPSASESSEFSAAASQSALGNTGDAASSTYISITDEDSHPQPELAEASLPAVPELVASSDNTPVDSFASRQDVPAEAAEPQSHQDDSMSQSALDASDDAAVRDNRDSTLDDSRFDSADAVETTQPAEDADPFLVDDDADGASQEEAEESLAEAPVGLSIDTAQQSLAQADEVPLAQASSPSDSTPHVDEPPPPPPPKIESDDEEEATPELYLPGLTLPTMFHPISNTDPLSLLLSKYIPPEKRPARDLSGNWHGADFNALVMTNSWRALAKMARDRIVEADPEDLDLVLSLWYIRLSCLARLRFFNQTSTECVNLYTVLEGIEPASARQWLFDKKLPFELEVLHVRLKYWAGDHMGYLDALAGLLKQCKAKARHASGRKDASTAAMWQERGARMCLIIASQLIEMKDFAAAARLLEPLCRQGDVRSPHVQSAVARIYLQGGYVSAAARHFGAVARDPSADASLKALNSALLASANGDWPAAVEALQQMLAADPENFVAINNLAVAYLSQGRIQEGIRMLEEAIKLSPSTTLQAEPLLFNLSTMYELRSTAGIDKKMNMLVDVAKWAGDGLRTTCLKMPAS